MKKWMFLLAFASVSALAQTSPPGTISHPANQASSNADTSSTASTSDDVSAGSLTFTNSAGVVYSVERLAEQLSQLRAVTDQTLPLLSAFTENYSNLANGNQTVAGRLSNILSGALNRDSGQTNATSQTSAQLTNLFGGLQKLLGKSPTNAIALDPTTVRELVTLQKDLQPVVADLQKLNVGPASTNEFSQPS